MSPAVAAARPPFNPERLRWALEKIDARERRLIHKKPYRALSWTLLHLIGDETPIGAALPTWKVYSD